METHWGKEKVLSTVVSKEGDERTHHYWFSWKRCNCKQYSPYLLNDPHMKYLVLKVWSKYVFNQMKYFYNHCVYVVFFPFNKWLHLLGYFLLMNYYPYTERASNSPFKLCVCACVCVCLYLHYAIWSYSRIMIDVIMMILIDDTFTKEFLMTQ